MLLGFFLSYRFLFFFLVAIWMYMYPAEASRSYEDPAESPLTIRAASTTTPTFCYGDVEVFALYQLALHRKFAELAAKRQNYVLRNRCKSISTSSWGTGEREVFLSTYVVDGLRLIRYELSRAIMFSDSPDGIRRKRNVGYMLCWKVSGYTFGRCF